ncbi:hypothetical protein TRFO_37790 [Tritrichomonas foetus]|uniref:Uncharacterized protein n=1 Tax=Tritrichomonas foetus TaxID=1144522 RepID=A0A1J4JCV4_9EUKA|nr:hypothetical protein TRFO_37790 [Tritrichomonas foetus]|eukprot:OHS96087.1 hypothetical protein TRFO_37790 [Tritrichomonas foetus]
MNQENEKRPITLEKEDSLHRKIKSVVTRLNAEISIEDKESKYLNSLNSMFDMFETIYNKNIYLIDECKHMNGQVIRDAAKVKELLTQSDESQETLQRLKKEYESVTEQAAALRSSENDSRDTIRNLRNKLIEFKKTIEEKEREGIQQQNQQLESLSNEVKQLQEETSKSSKELKKIQNIFQRESTSLNSIVELNKKYSEEYNNNIGQVDKYDDLIEDMRKDNRQTKVDMENSNNESERLKVVLADTSEYDKEMEKIHGLEDQLAHLKLQINGLHNQHDNILINCSKKQKELRHIEKDSNVKMEQLKEVQMQYKRRLEQFERYKTTIEDLDRETKTTIPEYKSMVLKYQEVSKAKENLRQKSNELQNKLYEVSLKQSKSEHEKHGKVRMVSTAKLDLTQNQTRKKEEENKTLEVIGQKQTLIYDQITSKQKSCDMKRKMSLITSETEEHLNTRKLALTNYLSVADIANENNAKNDELIMELGKIRKQSETKNQQIEKVKEEKSSLKKQLEMEKSEHDQLNQNYKELVTSIVTMTEKVEELTKKAEHDHFFANEMKVAVGALSEMRQKTIGGMKITEKVINNLQGEEQTLRRIIEQTILDQQKNMKEFEDIRDSRTELQNQIAEKIKQIANQEDEIKTGKALLEKRAKDFNSVMERIDILSKELEDEQNHTHELEKKVEYFNRMKVTLDTLKEHMAIANFRRTALYQESACPRGFHRWHEIEAYDHDRFMNIKLVDHLRDQLHNAHEKYKKLVDKKEKMIQEIETLKVKKEQAMPLDEAANFLEALKEDLKQKERLIRAIKQKLNESQDDIGSTQRGMKNMRQCISQRKEVAFNLKSTLTETSRSARSSRPDTPTYYITEPPTVATANALGGGFRPHPPKSPRFHEIPRIRIEEIQPANHPPPANSQRYQRPNLGTLRKKLTRPVQTPRNDRTHKTRVSIM